MLFTGEISRLISGPRGKISEIGYVRARPFEILYAPAIQSSYVRPLHRLPYNSGSATIALSHLMPVPIADPQLYPTVKYRAGKTPSTR
jgi:hypothetical protein